MLGNYSEGGSGMFYNGLAAVMQMIRDIWSGIMGIEFFGAGFTFKDVLIAIFFADLGIYLLYYFAHGSTHSNDVGSSGGIKYD